MPNINNFGPIQGVKLVQLETYDDERGTFLEVFRKEWFPEREWHMLQNNRSISSAGVLRGLHFHHKQVDYWYLTGGHIRAGLVDLRPSSPTFKNGETIELDAAKHQGLFIPPGVAHGFYTVTDASLIYVVDHYYDGADEFGVAWNDPEFNLAWGVTEPLLSKRDKTNPRFKAIPLSELPG